jgi:hypothetical protein
MGVLTFVISKDCATLGDPLIDLAPVVSSMFFWFVLGYTGFTALIWNWRGWIIYGVAWLSWAISYGVRELARIPRPYMDCITKFLPSPYGFPSPELAYMIALLACWGCCVRWDKVDLELLRILVTYIIFITIPNVVYIWGYQLSWWQALGTTLIVGILVTMLCKLVFAKLSILKNIWWRDPSDKQLADHFDLIESSDIEDLEDPPEPAKPSSNPIGQSRPETWEEFLAKSQGKKFPGDQISNKIII